MEASVPGCARARVGRGAWPTGVHYAPTGAAEDAEGQSGQADARVGRDVSARLAACECAPHTRMHHAR